MRLTWLSVLAASLLSLGAGCNASLNFNYRPQVVLAEAKTAQLRLAVAPVEDRRIWKDASGADAAWLVGLYPPRKFGVSFRGRKYAPVSEVVRQLVMDDLRRAGVDAFAAEETTSTAGNDGVLRIQLEDFRWTHGVESLGLLAHDDRSVAMSVSLILNGVAQPVLATTVAASDSDGGVLGRAHETNIDRLFNRDLAQASAELVGKVVQAAQSVGASASTSARNDFREFARAPAPLP